MDAVQEHIDLLQATKAMLEKPIKDIPLYEGRAIVDDALPMKADLAQNTRYGSSYHTDFLEEFLQFIDHAAKHKPGLNPSLEGQDMAMKIVSPD
ncbi:MAG: hypothetical protein ACLFR0_07840 [Alphaproteobacteria bacterium]